MKRFNDFLKGTKLLWSITITCLMAFTLLGYDQGVMSCIIGNPVFNNYYNNPDADLQGDIVGCYDLGSVGGSIFVYFFGERFGRRKLAILGSFIMTISAIIVGCSQNLAMFITFRTINGFGNGINSSTIPVIQAECSPASSDDKIENDNGKVLARGGLLTLQGTVTIFGLVVAYWTGYGTSFYSTSFQWRFPIIFQIVFSIAMFVQCLYLPDTPRWLVAHDRVEEARKLLGDLYNVDPSGERISNKIFDIQSAIEEENKDGPFHFKEFFTMGKVQNFRRLLLSIYLMIIQQFSGSNMINYYAPIIYQTTMGLSQNLSNILGGCTSITYLVGSVIPVFIIDKYGRRNLLMISLAGLSICFIMVTILLSLDRLSTSYGAIAFIFLYQIAYGIGLLPVPWYYTSEINTTRLRSRAASISSAFNWLAVYCIVKITPIINENLRWKSFIIFAVLNAFFIPCVYAFYPETAGLELEDIDLIFERGGLTGGVWSTRGRTIVKHAHLIGKLDEEAIVHEEKEDVQFVEKVDS